VRSMRSHSQTSRDKLGRHAACGQHETSAEALDGSQKLTAPQPHSPCALPWISSVSRPSQVHP